MDWAYVSVIVQCQTDGCSLRCKDGAVVWPFLDIGLFERPILTEQPIAVSIILPRIYAYWWRLLSYVVVEVRAWVSNYIVLFHGDLISCRYPQLIAGLTYIL